MTAAGEHIVESKDGAFRVDCTLKPVFDHFLVDERERRQEEHLHRESIYNHINSLDRRVTKVETKIAVYAVGAAAIFQTAVLVIGKIAG